MDELRANCPNWAADPSRSGENGATDFVLADWGHILVKIHGKSMGNPWEIYGKSMENLELTTVILLFPDDSSIL